MTRHFIFVGVTTGQSSMMRLFPLWRDILALGADVELIGYDLQIHAPPERYRQTVEAIKADPGTLGGLVTTHKIDLFRAARDLFDEVDNYARHLGEVSCFAWRDGRFWGGATDPVSAGPALQDLLGLGYFRRTGGHVLCLGAGGAGQAIVLHFATRAEAADRPGRIVITDRDGDRLAGLRDLLRRVGSTLDVEYVQTAASLTNDHLLGDMPPRSLIINATGMGKDTPGSPLSSAASFPPQAIGWDLNYRGELDFLQQARAQPASRRVRVEDGWQYFMYGWAAVIEQVFQRPISTDEMKALEEAASFARPAPTSRSRV